LASEWGRLEEIQVLLQPFADQANILQTDSQSLSSIVPSVLDLECHLQKIVEAYPSAKDVAADLLTELRNRFE
jgi:hypothetical protein